MALRDYLNFESTADFANFTLQNGQAVAILTMDGITPLETWYFNASSMAIPNGTTVFKPNAIDIANPGRYIKNITSSDWDTTLNKPVFADVAISGDYNDLDNKITAGIGIVMDNNEISVDDTQFMSKSEADLTLAKMQAEIATKVPEPRTITINGITQDLEANRDWEVGDLSSSGNYNNPIWINSLAYSKLTGVPLIPATQIQSNWTQSNNTSLDFIKNKPTIINNTAGTGISINSGVINNTSPDQTVVLTAGNGISITGTYPNFTITNTYIPTINDNPGRAVNTNYTPSTTRPTIGFYSLTCTVTNPLLVGTSSAMAYLEESINAGSTWSLVEQNGNSSGVGITVTLQLTNGQTGLLTAPMKANTLYRIRTATTGTASVALIAQREIIL